MAAPKTILQIVNQAQAELGLTQSTTVVGNTADLSAPQFLALLNSAGEELRDYAEDVRQGRFPTKEHSL